MKIYADLGPIVSVLAFKMHEMFLNGFSDAIIDAYSLMKLPGDLGESRLSASEYGVEIQAIKTRWPKQLSNYLIMLRYIKLQFIQITRFPLT